MKLSLTGNLLSMLRFCGLVLLTALPFSSSTCSKEELSSEQPKEYTKATIPYKTVTGVDPNLTSLDIYYFDKQSGLKPVVVYVHGGAWAIGDKANSMENKINLFSSLDYLLVSVNYRLSPSTFTNDPARIKFPTHNEDVADAVKWISDNIVAYGGDNSKIALLGHSAGAHLVSLTGTSNQFLPARGIPLSAIRGIASIDTEGYNVVGQVTEANEVYINAFGTDAANLIIASPIEQVFQGTTYPNFFIAKRGSASRIGLANIFISKLESVGVNVSQITANQYDHEGINDAIGKENETAITVPLKSFLRQCFE